MTPSRHSTVRTLVVADQVVGQAVTTALEGNGLPATCVSWRELDRLRVARSVADRVDVGLLLSDLDSPARVRRACDVVGAVGVPWLVLTGATRGPLWGSVLDAGAAMVRGSGTGLDELVSVLGRAAAGEREPVGEERASLVAAWSRMWRQRADTLARLETLSPREREVLRLLYRGDHVAVIADELGVATSTVRTQVKSVLRKLGVSSQLGAVAAYGFLRASGHQIDAVPPVLRPEVGRTGDAAGLDVPTRRDLSSSS